MQDLLNRLYKTRVTLLAVLLTVAGLTLIASAPRPAGVSLLNWLRDHETDLGLALAISGFFTVAWQYFTQEVADEHTTELFRGVLKKEAPDLRDAVIDAFAFKAEDLARVTSPAVLDQIIRNCLALQLGDRRLAEDVYNDVKQQVIHASERRYGVDVSVVLTPWEGGPAYGDGSMFVATVRWEYRVTPLSPVMRFSCVSDLDTYRELFRDPTSSGVWYFQPKAGLAGVQ